MNEEDCQTRPAEAEPVFIPEGGCCVLCVFIGLLFWAAVFGGAIVWVIKY